MSSRFRLSTFVCSCCLLSFLVGAAACTGSEESASRGTTAGTATATSTGGTTAGSTTTGSTGQCTEVTCKPPPCCEDSCTDDSDCCEGTICGVKDRCIPASCGACGDLGCTIDFEACTAECKEPSTCLNSCTSDEDCAAGTHCDPNGENEEVCFPNGCDSCGGMQPVCRTSDDCSFECVAPDSCGDICSSDADCGNWAVCETFEDGSKKCVPEAFDSACGACGSVGCTFYGDECRVTCQSPDDPPEPSDTGQPEPDTNYSVDTTTPDDPPAPDVYDYDDTGSPTEPTCADCCQPCQTDDDCCGANVCDTDEDGNKRCIPATCHSCTHGCTFRCP